jgi:hypothetical protein
MKYEIAVIFVLQCTIFYFLFLTYITFYSDLNDLNHYQMKYFISAKTNCRLAIFVIAQEMYTVKL